MIQNPIPGIDSEQQIKIKEKGKLVGKELGHFKFTTKVAEDMRPPFT